MFNSERLVNAEFKELLFPAAKETHLIFMKTYLNKLMEWLWAQLNIQ